MIDFTEPFPEAVASWCELRAEVAAHAFQPKSRLTLSQWSDQYRYLSSDLGEPGPWRTSRVPYLREPMDCITDPTVTEVAVMKCARVGATQGLVINGIFFHVHQEATAMIAAFPTEGDAKKFSKLLLAPAIAETPVIAELIEDGKGRDAKNTIQSKSFPSGGLQIVGTSSPRNMRMVHGRVVYGSEVDAWDYSAGDDGDPMTLLRKRADAYGAPKFVWESTPLLKGFSRIEQQYKAGDQRLFHVPCPHCDEGQPLVWGGRDCDFGIKWRDRDPRTAYYLCRQCHHPIEEVHKHAIVDRGLWIPQNAAKGRFPSFHLGAFISPFEGARWARLVEIWYEAQGKAEQLRVFRNTVEGLPWEDEGARVDSDKLKDQSRRTIYPCDCAAEGREHVALQCTTQKVPDGVLLITVSGDTQGDRVERAVWGWGEGEECWPLEHEIIPGDPGIPEGQRGSPWNVFAKRLTKEYVSAAGEVMRPEITVVDVGGHHSKEANAFCRAHLSDQVFAIFGATSEGAPLVGRASRNNSAKTIHYPVGSFTGKEALQARLTKVRNPGPGYIHIPDWMDDEQLAQFAAEQLVTRLVGGRPKRTWVKLRDRNEMTDLWVYGLAAVNIKGPNILKLRAQALARVAAEERRREGVREEVRADPEVEAEDVEEIVDRVAPPPKARRRRGGGWNVGGGRGGRWV